MGESPTHPIGTRYGALADSVVAQGRSQIAGIESRVREQPLMALGLAFMAGLVFAKMGGR